MIAWLVLLQASLTIAVSGPNAKRDAANMNTRKITSVQMPRSAGFAGGFSTSMRSTWPASATLACRQSA